MGNSGRKKQCYLEKTSAIWVEAFKVDVTGMSGSKKSETVGNRNQSLPLGDINPDCVH